MYSILEKVYILKEMLFLTLYFYNPEKKKFSKKKHNTTLTIIRNVSWASNQDIRMISEGSRDTEDWSNDDENSALITAINYILKYIKIRKVILNCITVLQYFWSNTVNAAFVSIRDLRPKPLNVSVHSIEILQIKLPKELKNIKGY